MTRYFYILPCSVFLFFMTVGNVFSWHGTVVKVIDGDSLKIYRSGKEYEIRLYGIDTPEYRQPYSNKAKQFTRRLVFRQNVTVEEKDTDRYGRIVAIVQCRGKLLNRELVREGLAWYYPRYCRDQPLCGELQSLEQAARKYRRGIWRDDDPIAPWDWKRQQKPTSSKGRTGWYSRFLDWL